MTYENKVWTFDVATDQFNQTMSLNLSLSTSIPPRYSVRLIDMKTDSVIDLRINNCYTYNTGTDSLRMFQIIVGGSITISHTYDAGWNMVGLPLKLNYSFKDSVFNQASSIYLYEYSTNVGYSLVDRLNPGKGYWLGALSPTPSMITVVQIMDSVNIPLEPGFNIISLPYYVNNYSIYTMRISNGFTTVSFDSAVSLNWVSPVLYSYNNTIGGYSSIDTLTPWNGYWFAALDSSLQLVFEPPANLDSLSLFTQKLKTTVKNRIYKTTIDSSWFVKLTLNTGKALDQLGGFGVASCVKVGFNSLYDLPHPPNPPSNDYAYLAFPHPEWESVIGPNFSTDIKPIAQSSTWKFIVESSTYPIEAEITWDSSKVPSGIIMTDFGNKLVSIDMNKSGIYKFSLNEIDSMQITYTITGNSQQSIYLPLTYAMYQNFPNPFNPSTMISYDIPKQSYVKLVIYDVLGRRVKTLVDEVKSPGSYKILFDASGLSSGVYIYRITSGNFVQTKKLVLLK
jgi:hypothetical protein